MDAFSAVADRCRALVAALRHTPDSLFSHLPDASSLHTDHLLTTSAIVACLAHGDPARDLLRLAALTHALPPDRQRQFQGDEAGRLAPWLAALHAQDAALAEGTPHPALPPTDLPLRWLLLAHLAASAPPQVATRADLADHPLAGAGAVALIFGGVTKVKAYVFESVRLPEIRGASVLLDHINQLDIPALWGVEPDDVSAVTQRAQRQHMAAARAWFAAAFGQPPLDAPECLLYASGGHVLALAPVALGAALAEAIERRYTTQTLVAQRVAVWEQVGLLDLHYGTHAHAFWQPEATALLAQEGEAATLLRQNLGQQSFEAQRGFGALVARLARMADRRRASEGMTAPPHLELFPAARRCDSCDVRPASEAISDADGQERLFCRACKIKHEIGRWAKRGRAATEHLPWVRPWATWLEQQEPTRIPAGRIYATANDLHDIGVDANGYVGLIYADGNNVGSYLAQLRTIHAYRHFARKMLAANERAVARALADHIVPDAAGTWPFEVLTIGGDDVLLFVPATKALPVALTLARAFEQEMAQEGITHSIGILLMPEHTPVRFARDLVGELLESAKARAKRQPSVPVTMLDFMALKGVSMVSEDIRSFRTVAYQRGDFALTQRPYTLEQMATLVRACAALQAARFPRSQLYQLSGEVARANLLQSVIDYGYFVARGKRRGAGASPYHLFDELVAELCGQNGWAPWGRAAGDDVRFATPLLDIIELYPFVPAEMINFAQSGEAR